MPPVFFLALSKANASFLLITKKKILLARPSASQLLFYGKQYWYIAENVEVPSVTITSSSSGTKVTTSTSAASAASGGSASPSSLHPSSHRRKKPKRRSTGVVNLDVDVSSLLSNLLWPLLPPLLWLCARPYSALLAQLQLGSQYHQTR